MSETSERISTPKEKALINTAFAILVIGVVIFLSIAFWVHPVFGLSALAGIFIWTAAVFNHVLKSIRNDELRKNG